MFHTMFLFLLLGTVVAATAAAQPVARPTVAVPSPGTIDPATGGFRPGLTLPLTRDEAARLRQRLRESLSRQAARAPRSTALRQAGLPAETDAVTRADDATRTRTLGPLGVGLAEARPNSKSTVADPALTAVARQALRARLDREPTAAEIDKELRAFDARVERANRWLAANRARIAKAYASRGTLPPSFDAEALDPAPTGRTIDSAWLTEGYRALFRSLLAQPDQAGPGTPPVVPGEPLVPARPTSMPSAVARPPGR